MSRVFNPLKLQHIVTLPKPHFLGVNIAAGMDLRYYFVCFPSSLTVYSVLGNQLIMKPSEMKRTNFIKKQVAMKITYKNEKS